jgi:hypothetical protein
MTGGSENAFYWAAHSARQILLPEPAYFYVDQELARPTGLNAATMLTSACVSTHYEKRPCLRHGRSFLTALLVRLATVSAAATSCRFLALASTCTSA